MYTGVFTKMGGTRSFLNRPNLTELSLQSPDEVRKPVGNSKFCLFSVCVCGGGKNNLVFSSFTFEVVLVFAVVLIFEVLFISEQVFNCEVIFKSEVIIKFEVIFTFKVVFIF